MIYKTALLSGCLHLPVMNSQKGDLELFAILEVVQLHPENIIKQAAKKLSATEHDGTI